MIIYVVMLDKSANVCYNEEVECAKSVQETSNLERKGEKRRGGGGLLNFFRPERALYRR